MQDQREGDSPYVTHVLDSYSWSILDPSSALAYVLMLTPLGNFTAQIALVELGLAPHSKNHLTFVSEILTVVVQVSEMKIAQEIMQSILNDLDGGVDIANPIEIAATLGADLHGQPVKWQRERAH